MKKRWLMRLSLAGMLVSGCAALPRGSVIFSHTPLLPTGTISATAVLRNLEDKRPPQEHRALKNIEHMDEQVTSLLLEDFQHVKLFNALELTSDASHADLLLRGEIRSLTWSSRWYPITFIPYVNLVTLLGFPAGINTGSVRIYLEVVNTHSGKVLTQYEKSSGASRTYSIYQANEYRVAGGEETREALRTVFDELKKSIWDDRTLLSTARPAESTPSASSP